MTSTPGLGSLRGKRILLGVSSSIAAYRALDIASQLRQAGAEVRAVLSDHAPKLVGPAAFDAITHQRTILSLWDSPHAGEMDHLAATKWADFFVLAPATANLLAALAHGTGRNALETLLLAWNKRPLLIAPAMNPEMWRNPAVQANVAALRERGHRFVGPAEGRMACDDVGTGRLAAVEDILGAIVALAQETAAQPAGSLAGRTILVTAGATREFLDAVRCLTNPSTGRQGYALSREAAARGARVVLVHGKGGAPPPDEPAIELVPVESAEEMRTAALKALPQADAAIFAAAVSDWRPAQPLPGKPKKEGAPASIQVELVRTPDVAVECHRARPPGRVFVGFAAEVEDLEKNAREKMNRKGFQLLFANLVDRPEAGFASENNTGVLLGDDGLHRVLPLAGKDRIAAAILDELEKRLEPPANR